MMDEVEEECWSISLVEARRRQLERVARPHFV